GVEVINTPLQGWMECGFGFMGRCPMLVYFVPWGRTWSCCTMLWQGDQCTLIGMTRNLMRQGLAWRSWGVSTSKYSLPLWGCAVSYWLIAPRRSWMGIPRDDLRRVSVVCAPLSDASGIQVGGSCGKRSEKKRCSGGRSAFEKVSDVFRNYWTASSGRGSMQRASRCSSPPSLINEFA